MEERKKVVTHKLSNCADLLRTWVTCLMVVGGWSWSRVINTGSWERIVADHQLWVLLAWV